MRVTSTGFSQVSVAAFILVTLIAPSVSASTTARPVNPPVIYLHYDFMPGEAPNATSIRLVVDAFANHGIRLVIDPQHTVLPWHQTLLFGAPIGACPSYPGQVEFNDLESQYFKPKGNLPWHYVIFGHDLLGPGLEGTSGCRLVSGEAEISGFTFAVAHHSIFPDLLKNHGLCQPHSFTSFCQMREGGIFMHELGHNLGLLHGGDENKNYKPNYISVMNYAFLSTGIPYTLPNGTVAWRLDYSNYTYPTLDENHLNETAGLGGYPGDRDLSKRWCTSGGTVLPIWIGCLTPTTGAVDWNNDGLIEQDVQYEVSYNGTAFSHSYTALQGFNDWAWIQQFTRTPQYVSGQLHPTAADYDSVNAAALDNP